jgi:Acetyl-CoA dehydrogenase C-terminal like/Acyl-CoA dehydrogenase N terminal
MANFAITYSAPVKDMLFVMNELAGLSQIITHPKYVSLGRDFGGISKILEKAASKTNQHNSDNFQIPKNFPRLVATAYKEIINHDDTLVSISSNIAFIDRIYQKCLHRTGMAGEFNSVNGFTDEMYRLHIMRSYSESLRALGYYSASLDDAVTSTTNACTAGVNRAIYEFLSPISHGFSTELALEVASLGAQIHRDWNFAPQIELSKVVEADVSVWVNDLVLQKTLKDGGAVGRVLVRKIEKTEADLGESTSDNALSILKHLKMGREALEQSLDFLLKTNSKFIVTGSAGKAYLQICGLVLSGWQMARASLAAERLREQDCDFYEAKIMTAKFFMANVLPRTQSLLISLANHLGE